ncbi:MAG: hydroxyphenylacetyl-CoA thioesterase PaaI [Gemmatimonadales bacterium]|nr:hydroxyphenylacetyl-CoA thioesterase PaaI [Gemmatimonadales bacterium]
MSEDAPRYQYDRDVRAEEVVQRMLSRDAFSQWLGVEVLEVAAQQAVIRMTVRPEMANGFGFAHGGIVFSFADSAHAFATNSSGEISVAIDCSVSYPAAVRTGDVLTASAVEQTSTNRLAFCEVTVRNQRDEVVGHFRGTVYRTRKPLPE